MGNGEWRKARFILFPCEDETIENTVGIHFVGYHRILQNAVVAVAKVIRRYLKMRTPSLHIMMTLWYNKHQQGGMSGVYILSSFVCDSVRKSM